MNSYKSTKKEQKPAEIQKQIGIQHTICVSCTRLVCHGGACFDCEGSKCHACVFLKSINYNYKWYSGENPIQ